MKTHDQLAALATLLQEAGWVRLNGNTWGLPLGHGQWQLTTGYTYQEATLKLYRVDRQTSKLAPNKYYRGADPLSWAPNIPRIKTSDALDKLS